MKSRMTFREVAQGEVFEKFNASWTKQNSFIGVDGVGRTVHLSVSDFVIVDRPSPEEYASDAWQDQYIQWILTRP